MRFNIGPKLLTSFAAVLIIPTVAVGIFSYESAKSGVSAQIQNSAQSSVNLFNETLNQYIGAKEQDIKVLSSEINGLPTSQMWKYVQKYQAQHPELETTYIGTTNEAFVNAPHNIMPKSYVPTKRPWYQQAIANPGKVIITPPYVSVSSGQMVVTIAEQTADKKAVVAENLQLKTIQSIVNNIKIGQQGYLILLDGQKHNIAVRGQKAGAFTSGPLNMYDSTSGKIFYTWKGQPKVMVFTTNPTTGWKIAGTYYNQESTQAANPILMSTITVIIIAIILGALLVILVVRSILKPMRTLIQASKKIGEGDLTEAVVIKNNDEFGDLGYTFDQMRESIRSILNNITNTSQQVASAAEELMASSDQSSQAAQNIAETIQEVATGSERQASSVDESSRIVQEMSGGIQQIAVNAQQVSTNSSESTDAVSDGQQSITSVVEQMDHINSTVTGLLESVQKLNSRSHQIGDIVEIIRQIASQTNLLSLNASIEAARAGEHGKGFAVVADEIRKLATQSAQSAQDISDLVSTIQSDTNEAVRATESTTEAVSKGMGAVDLAGQSFERIHKNVTAVADQIQEVSAAVEEMSASSEEVSRSMNAIAEIAQDTAGGTQNVSAATEEQLATMQEVNASATELARMAEELQEIIGKFTV